MAQDINKMVLTMYDDPANIILRIF